MRCSLVGCLAKHVIQDVTSNLLETVLSPLSKLNICIIILNNNLELNKNNYYFKTNIYYSFTYSDIE